jgi:NYN domain/OST-HTH/LOTUS domain
MADADGKSLALLIDADNVPPKLIPSVMERDGEIGRFVVRRLYGNLTTLSKIAWRHHIHEYALSPVLVLPATGTKNAADMRLAIDAMDLVAERDLDGLCIVSSDSDFTVLAIRVRESGLAVCGFGEAKTPAAYVSACTVFYRLGEAAPARSSRPAKEPPPAALAEKPSSPARAAAAPTSQPAARRGKDAVPAADVLAAVEESAHPDGWAALSTVRQKLGRRVPNFNLRNYGYRKFRDLVAEVDGIETRETKSAGGAAITVRRRAAAPPA